MNTYQSALQQAEKIVGDIFTARYTDMPTEKDNVGYFLKGEGLVSKNLAVAENFRDYCICHEFCGLMGISGIFYETNNF